MFKKRIHYVDYNGVERDEDFYFNLNRAELSDMDFTTVGGIKAFTDRIVMEKDVAEIMKLFKEIILKAYGKKSDDGKRFIKNQELRDEFEQTEAFVELYMELLKDADAAAKFMNSIIPRLPEEAKDKKVEDEEKYN